MDNDSYSKDDDKGPDGKSLEVDKTKMMNGS
jgi:hypothetical protein